MAGEDDIALGIAELDLPVRRGDAQPEVVGDGAGPQGRAAEPGQDTVGPGAFRRDHIASTAGRIGFDIDRVRGQPVRAGRRR